ncbi:hypothetical protein BDB00DRAFT_873812 [Zychaea mexicana]|uniref:uncharacterized protein n=1 Tax=Zychaea mexicana TaxID=64656 RepID=UPI0022FEE88F|nr:uncharacterized protein BDB00DRAFT_873812 [Zychaea mexicana]KAI9491977.1 hypothetical protein BDB00DRAFT_873812 [Zychaea mexicana]
MATTNGRSSKLAYKQEHAILNETWIEKFQITKITAYAYNKCIDEAAARPSEQATLA